MLLDPRWEKKIDEVPAADEAWRKVLRDAAQLLEVEGWCIDSYHDSFCGKRCAVGAIRAVMPNWRRSAMPLFNEVYSRLFRFVKTGLSSIEAWNDIQCNAAPVIKAMRDCAES